MPTECIPVWTKLEDAGFPSFLAEAPNVVFDSFRQETVVTSSRKIARFKGKQWTNEVLADGPQFKEPAIAFDTKRGTVLLNGVDEANTWEWNGNVFSRTVDGPRLRASAMAYDSVRNRVVLFGGADGRDQPIADLWEWDGVIWTELTPRTQPPKLAGALMAYDAVRSKFVLTGGLWRTEQVNSDTGELVFPSL